MSSTRKIDALRGVVLAAVAALAGSCASELAEEAGPASPAAGKVPEGWEVVDAAPGAQGFAKKARDPATGITFILVEPGTFLMGSPDGEVEATRLSLRERPQHEVEITKPFYLGESEVTIGQWRQFARNTGYRTEAEETGEGGWTVNAAGDTGELRKNAIWSKPLPAHNYDFDDLHPVTQVSWNDAHAFCEEYCYRLPSEAEWEYACRAGTTGAFWWGAEEAGGESRGNFADQAARSNFPEWKTVLLFSFNDGHGLTAPVGTFAPNPWGFRDMLGNVWEWCVDVLDERYYERAPRVDPLNAGGAGGGARVARGGSWGDGPLLSRAACRLGSLPNNRYSMHGFRVAR